MILLDTSGLLSALDASQTHHAAAAAALREAGEPRLLSPFVLAELDYLITTRVSARVTRSLLREVADGAYQLEPFLTTDVARAAEIIERFEDQWIGLADASLVVLAERHDVADILTLDERHFRVLPGPHARPFRLLPADAAAE